MAAKQLTAIVAGGGIAGLASAGRHGHRPVRRRSRPRLASAARNTTLRLLPAGLLVRGGSSITRWTPP
jgi:hypothetical protein